MKIYHKQGAKLIDSNQGDEFFFPQDNISHQLGNGYPQFDVTLRKNGGSFYNVEGDGNIDEYNRLVNLKNTSTSYRMHQTCFANFSRSNN